jgi:phage shock protein PspC (stress-responsive transcriptional regulator)
MSEETPTTAAQPGPQPPPPPQGPAQGPQPEAQEPWATRFGLVRPRHGRYLAGVCAAIGRATNTDPLLWRVLIGVLAVFGVGIIIYLAGWLLTPAEGDTASPVEALLGRGTSSTSTVITLINGVIAVVLLGALTDSWAVAVIGAVALVVAAMAINPRISTPRPATPPPAPVPGPVTEQVTPPVSAYQPPFAPHGPYQPASSVPVPPRIPQLPKLKPEPSRLGRLIFGLVLIALGVMGIVDMAGFDVPGAAYVAAALAVVGVGLIIGAWYGRARGFIFLGLVLSLLLPAVASGPDMAERSRGGTVLWNPGTPDRVSDHYEHRFGEATLDLTQVDFAGQNKEISADISFGQLRILVPPNVDTRVISDISFGDASVFNKEINGVGVDQSADDTGADGEGGGNLVIRLNVRFGHAEVTR